MVDLENMVDNRKKGQSSIRHSEAGKGYLCAQLRVLCDSVRAIRGRKVLF